MDKKRFSNVAVFLDRSLSRAAGLFLALGRPGGRKALRFSLKKPTSGAVFPPGTLISALAADRRHRLCLAGVSISNREKKAMERILLALAGALILLRRPTRSGRHLSPSGTRLSRCPSTAARPGRLPGGHTFFLETLHESCRREAAPTSASAAASTAISAAGRRVSPCSPRGFLFPGESAGESAIFRRYHSTDRKEGFA